MSKRASVDTQELYRWLCDVKVGDLITYKELSDIIGRDVQGEGYPLLVTARRWALRHDRIVFAVEKNIGMRRCNDSEKINEAAAGRERMVGQAKRSAQILGATNYDNLSRREKISHNVQLAQFGCVVQMFSPPAIAATEKRFHEIDGKIDEKQYLAQFLT